MPENKKSVEKLNSKQEEGVSGGYIVNRANDTEGKDVEKGLMNIPKGRPLPMEVMPLPKPLPKPFNLPINPGPAPFPKKSDHNLENNLNNDK